MFLHYTLYSNVLVIFMLIISESSQGARSLLDSIVQYLNTIRELHAAVPQGTVSTNSTHSMAS